MVEDPVRALYERESYPAMSHPLSDPALSAVAACLGGLKPVAPARARMLEIGCGTGHHLIPLALRWPESEFVGIDFDEKSINQAKELACVAGAKNVRFEAADLRDYPIGGETYDYIIAHGFFSWVVDDLKARLLQFCGSSLSAKGIATISFNVESGWAKRYPVIDKARRIQEAGGVGVMVALEVLREITEADSPEILVIDDLLERGMAILPFDDFAPVNDAWSLEKFSGAAAAAGLQWMGETDPAENVPSCLGDEQVRALAGQYASPLEFQMAADALVERKFRSGVLGRADAPLDERIFLDRVFGFALRAGRVPVGENRLALWHAILAHAPGAVAAEQVCGECPDLGRRELASLIYEGITCGWIRARIEPLVYDSSVPHFPQLSSFRQFCAKARLPLVDAWHVPCTFPSRHFEILEVMDGSRSLQDLARYARSHCPELAFDRWMRHLSERGMFS